MNKDEPQTMNVQEEFYERIHLNAYKLSKKETAIRQKLVLSLIESIEQKTNEIHILDIGFNNTRFPSLLKKNFPNAHIKLVDVDNNRVDLAKKDGFDAFQCDVSNNKLPFTDNYFDLIHAAEIIEHVFDTDHLLTEIKRVLKPRGTFILTTPNLAAWYNRILFPLFGIQPFHTEVSLYSYYGRKPFKEAGGNPVGHIHVFTTKAINEMLNLNGFKVLNIKGYPHPLIETNIIEKFFSHFPSFSTGIIVISTIL